MLGEMHLGDRSIHIAKKTNKI